MLCSFNGLRGCKIQATDGELGEVDDFYFDGKAWNIRYLAVNTGGRLYSRKVLIATAVLKREPDWKARSLPVLLTLDQVRSSPAIDTGKDVTRLHELELHDHYAWPRYWGQERQSGLSGDSVRAPEDEDGQKTEGPEPRPGPHLQSMHAAKGCRLRAADGLIGHVEDYIIDDAKWAVRYLVAGTGAWLPGRKVLISTRWIERADWKNSEMFSAMSRLAIKTGPQYDPSRPVSREDEERLSEHYGRPVPVQAGEGAAPQGPGL